MAFDLIIRGGTVADGRGSPLFEADIAVSGGRIAEIGQQPSPQSKGIIPRVLDIDSFHGGKSAPYSHLRAGAA